MCATCSGQISFLLCDWRSAPNAAAAPTARMVPEPACTTLRDNQKCGQITANLELFPFEVASLSSSTSLNKQIIFDSAKILGSETCEENLTQGR